MIHHLLKWATCVLALIVLASCGAHTTEEEVGISDQVEQPLCGNNGYWHGFEKRRHKHKELPSSRRGHGPPDHRDEVLCRNFGWECGMHRVGKGKGRGEQVDCGGCGDGDCELGVCVMDCVPNGTTTLACSEDETSVLVADSCGDLVETLLCAYGCEGAGVCHEALCGDGIVQPEIGEECDDGNTVDTDDCTITCLNALCGDGIVQDGVEECDDGDSNNNNGCANDCTPNTCGDGEQTGDEECDDGNDVNDDACSNNCTEAACGDAIVQPGEECDDGNQVNDDACTAACLNAVCGDGIVQDGVEECDDGNGEDTDACSNSCAFAICGDGIVQDGEQCDDGNEIDTDLCTSACQEARCGDGIIQPGETCDDGFNNGSPIGTCSFTCQVKECGNGIVEFPEICDDGNDDNTDTCTEDCKLPACGDSYLQPGEECDDGNMVNTDECTNMCRLPKCNDRIVQEGEECDDGNPFDTDGCTVVCTLAACGDGHIQPINSEVCDDGNVDAGDGCSDECVRENAPTFVTSAVYTGDLGGVDGADAKCQEAAEAAGLPGVYRAWLATPADGSPSTRFTQWPGDYVLVDGTVIANNWGDLVNFSIGAPISLDEYGDPAPASTAVMCGDMSYDTLVWSGASANGNAQIATYCGGWTSSSGNAHTGNRDAIDGTWSQWCFPGCSIQAPLYCFAQSLVSP